MIPQVPGCTDSQIIMPPANRAGVFLARTVCGQHRQTDESLRTLPTDPQPHVIPPESRFRPYIIRCRSADRRRRKPLLEPPVAPLHPWSPMQYIRAEAALPPLHEPREVVVRRTAPPLKPVPPPPPPPETRQELPPCRGHHFPERVEDPEDRVDLIALFPRRRAVMAASGSQTPAVNDPCLETQPLSNFGGGNDNPTSSLY